MTVNPTTLASKPNEAWFEDTWWWKIKVRMQWTGWLQYVPNLMLVLVTLALAGLGALIAGWSGVFVGLPLTLAALLFANLMFDIATVRFRLHPAEALPHPRNDLDEFEIMRSRRSCRSFQNRKLTPAHRQQVQTLARSYSQPENCIGSRPIRLEYVDAPLTVWPVLGASEFLVAIAEREYHEQAVVDIGRSLQQVVLGATRMGLATCWIGPGADPSSIAQHLGDRFNPERDHVICVCAVGYASRYKPLFLRFAQKQQRWRKELPQLFFEGQEFNAGIDLTSDVYSEFGRCFECCQWSPSSFNAQTTRAAAIVADHKLVRVDFCAATRSRYYAMVALGIWLANWEFGTHALGIKGRFATVAGKDPARPDLPRYVISWLRTS